jgi:hypothetical protein
MWNQSGNTAYEGYGVIPKVLGQNSHPLGSSLLTPCR